MRKSGRKALVYLPAVELMYAVITAGYGGKNHCFHVKPGYEWFGTLLRITVA